MVSPEPDQYSVPGTRLRGQQEYDDGPEDEVANGTRRGPVGRWVRRGVLGFRLLMTSITHHITAPSMRSVSSSPAFGFSRSDVGFPHGTDDRLPDRLDRFSRLASDEPENCQLS